MKNILTTILLLAGTLLSAQVDNPVYTNLPLGPHAVGFKIVTLTDPSRVDKPRYNYFGEKEAGDLHHKITLHLWYPAKPNTGKGVLTYGDYACADLLSSTAGVIDPAGKTAALKDQRESFQRFFGPVSDSIWEAVAGTRLLARKDAAPLREKFPMLVGTLRNLSTSVTNEMLASNGYVVGMVKHSRLQSPMVYIPEIADMQKAIEYASQTDLIDENTIGTFGFSGSGFTQVLFAMHDPRVGALADIESAIYGDGQLWERLAASDFCDVKKLRVPFLHIYGRELAKRDKSFEQFHNKIYSSRYHLLLNSKALHHWDVATEGRFSTTVAHNRGKAEADIRASFELTNLYLLHFFDAILKKSKTSQGVLASKSKLSNYADSLWSIQHYPALPAPPDKAQFETILNQMGLDTALAIARQFLTIDPATDFLHENILNQLARELRRQGKAANGLTMMRFATETHPGKAWLWLNRADMEENAGNKTEAIRCCEKVLDLLKDFNGPENSFDGRIRKSAEAALKSLKL